MIWRVMASVSGVAVIAAATHLNILHAGGYRSDGSLLIIAMAALLTVGMGFVGLQWNERRRAAAVGLALCILAGEVYWICTNAEREIAQREEQALPTAVALDQRLAAQKRLEQAEAGKRAAMWLQFQKRPNRAARPIVRNCCWPHSSPRTRSSRQRARRWLVFRHCPRLMAFLPGSGLARGPGISGWRPCDQSL